MMHGFTNINDLELLEIIWVAELIAQFDSILRLCSK